MAVNKAYDCDALIDTVTASGAEAVIPPRINRTEQRHFDRHLYQGRNLVERFFRRLKQFRRVSTRYDKLAASYHALVTIACILLWL